MKENVLKSTHNMPHLTKVCYSLRIMEYYSHYSAACLWGIPHLDTVLGTYGAQRALGNEAIDISVDCLNERYWRKGRILHSCNMDLPRDARVKKDGMMVSSPSLLFLELATKLDMQHLILLGLLLTSHPPGEPDKALTTKKKITKLVEAVPTYKGNNKAKQALEYIENGSASLVEALAYMIFVLPHSLGGYGFKGVTLNHEVELNIEAQKNLKQKRCFVDLYFGKARLAVEYDSFAHHNTPADQAKDMLRASVLERQGITVMRLGTVQLYDSQACELFVKNLAARLEKRIRIRNEGFEAAHQSLRALLPSQNAATN